MREAINGRRLARVVTVLLLFLAVGGVDRGQAETATLTIVTRDAAGHPVTVDLEVFEELPDAPPIMRFRGQTEGGRVGIDDLNPNGRFVTRFSGAAPTVIDGRIAGYRPIQGIDHQNAGRELRGPYELPGFVITLQGETAATLRIVLGGTFATDTTGVVVPMFDLAESDDAPPRPVHPTSGAVIALEVARTLTAPLGQPRGVGLTPEVQPTAQIVRPTEKTTISTSGRPWRQGLALTVVIVVMVAGAVAAFWLGQTRRGRFPQ